MSSRFISGGQIDAKGDAVTPSPDTTSKPPPPPLIASSSKKSEEWAAVQSQIETDRVRRQEQLQKQLQQQQDGGERSLFEILQANKAAKQAEFDEANKIKNQFRALYDDEVDFLDEVRERKRVEEERERRETEEGLRVFREVQQKGSSGVAKGEEAGIDETVDDGTVAGEGVEEWAVAGRKRKRKAGREDVIKGFKRRTSEQRQDKNKADEVKNAKGAEDGETVSSSKADTKTLSESIPAPEPPKAVVKPKAGLVDYGSEDDSD